MPKDWSDLSPLVDAVLDAPPERRQILIIELSGGDAMRQAALERLVAECGQQDALLNRPAAERFAELLAHDEAAVPDVLGDRYRIQRELGRGGMALVYLAHDLKHARDVAVKVIRPELAASLGRARFLREIAIAARLRHPNIVPLYDSGDDDGLLYFVMPYEDGLSLRAHLDRNGALPFDECVSTLRDVARALAYAHEQGVVHRDVKPDNVMLSGGAAVVTDFGIAKAVIAAQGETTATTLTQSGAGIGTPAYMAPEQAIGDPTTDHRADIYSFGCLAYEMLVGHPPFRGMPMHQLIAAHVGTTPVPVQQLRDGIPDAMARLVGRCLEKDPNARPQRAQELLAALEDRTPSLESVAASPVQPPVARPASRRVVAILVSIISVALAAGGYAFFRGRTSAASAAPRELTVAVLPLLSLGGDSLQRDLADGLSDDVATALFRVPGVRVMNRRSVGRYRGQRDIDYETAGRELGARYLVIGSLREIDGRLHVLATLVDSKDGAVRWSDQFDRSANELGAVRDEIAEAVGDILRTTLGGSLPASRAALSVGRSANPEAYRLYMLAQHALDRRSNIHATIDKFQRAAVLDTSYADAFSGLSLAVALSPYLGGRSAPEVAPEVRRTADRALRLNPALAQPHVALGIVHLAALEWDSADVELRTAVRLRAPGDVEPLLQIARYLIFRGRPAESIKYLLLAKKTEPASALISGWLAYAYYVNRQMDSAVVERARAYQNDSTYIINLTTGPRILWKAGRLAEMRALLRQAPTLNAGALFLLAALGDTAEAMSRLRAAQRTTPPLRHMDVLTAYTMLGKGDTAEALAALERTTDAKQEWATTESTLDPIFDSVRQSARFRALMRRLGLEESPQPTTSVPPRR